MARHRAWADVETVDVLLVGTPVSQQPQHIPLPGRQHRQLPISHFSGAASIWRPLVPSEDALATDGLTFLRMSSTDSFVPDTN